VVSSALIKVIFTIVGDTVGCYANTNCFLFMVATVLLLFGAPLDWAYPCVEEICSFAVTLVMGCFESKQSKPPPGYEDPAILSAETACKLHTDDFCLTRLWIHNTIFISDVE
jgi:hypothetical protein